MDRRVDELVAAALAAGDDAERYSAAVAELATQGGDEVVSAAVALAARDATDERVLGVIVLGGVALAHAQHRPVATGALRRVVSEEGDPIVLLAAIDALALLRDPDAWPVVVPHASHEAAAVRASVARTLSGCDDPRAVAALIDLASDPADEVRAEAVFALGSQCNADGDDVRRVLVDALHDDDDEIRTEAAIGLGRRADRRGAEVLRDALSEGSASIGAFEAAASLADERLVAALRELRPRAPDHWWLREWALACCDPSRRN